MRSVFAHTLARLLGPFRRAHRLQIGIGIGVDSVRILGAHAGAVAWVLEHEDWARARPYGGERLGLPAR